MNEEKKIKCPKCGQTDSVQKLSIVYGQSLLKPLRQYLYEVIEPPIKPNYNGLVEKYIKGNWKVIEVTEKYAGCLTGLGVMLISIGFPMFAWFYIVIRISLAIFGLPFSPSESTPTTPFFWTVFISLLFIPPAISLYLGLKWRKKFYQEHMPPWITTMEEWSKKFYCNSFNHVFIQDSPITFSTINIDWSGFQETDTKDRLAFENIHKTFLCISKNEHCVVCHKEISGFLFSNDALKGLVNLNPDDYVGFACPTCGTFYCKKCKKKTLKIAYVDGISQYMCSSCLSSTPTLDALIWFKGWYKTIKVLGEAKKKTS